MSPEAVYIARNNWASNATELLLPRLERQRSATWSDRCRAASDPAIAVGALTTDCRSDGGDGLLLATHHGLRLRVAPALQSSFEVGRRVRLGDVVVHAGVEAAVLILAHGIGGERDDGRMPALGQLALADGARRFLAIHLRHLTIHENEIVAVPGGALAGDDTVLGNFHFAAELCQQAGREHAIDGMIFDDQHPRP